MKIRFKRDHCVLYKWFMLLFLCAFVFGLAAGPAYGEEVRGEEAVIYPVIPFEGPLIPSNSDDGNIFLDKTFKSIRAQICATARKSAVITPEPELEYIGEFVATAYCNCAECCTVAGSTTASGVYPTANHTVACNCLPFGTQLYIDGIIYTVEDTGWTPYGDAWVDIFCDSHQSALEYGVRTVSVYIVH